MQHPEDFLDKKCNFVHNDPLFHDTIQPLAFALLLINT